MTAANRLAIGAPSAIRVDGTSPSFTSFALDASNDQLGWIFQADEAATITHLGFRYATFVGTPPTFRISLQTPSTTTGYPDGTILGGGTPASGTFTPPASSAWDGTWQWVALANSYTCTRGQNLCVVIDYSSGTINGSNKAEFTIRHDSTFGDYTIMHPYAATNNAGSWSKGTDGRPIFGYKSASASYGFPVESYYTTNTAGTNGHRAALAFTLPAGWGDTFKVAGIKGQIKCSNNTGQTFKLGLWDATTELQAVTLDSDVLSQNPSNVRLVELLFTETTLATLDFGTKYYIGVEVTSSSAVGMYGWQVDSSAELTAFKGGNAFHLATYNGSAWSDNQTVRPLCELLIDDITEPAGGGGAGIAALIGGSLAGR